MRLGLLGIGLLLFGAAASAHAADHWYDRQDPFRTGPTLDFGYSWGGDDLNRPDLVPRHKDISGPYYAGEGLSAGLGMMESFGDEWGLGFKQEAGFWEQTPFSSQSDDPSSQDPTTDSIGLQHSYFNFIAFLHWDEVAIGAGSVLQTDVTAIGGKVWDGTFDDFENAHGWLVMFQYKTISIRYTHIRYRVKHVANIPPVSGDNVGIYINLPFF